MPASTAPSHLVCHLRFYIPNTNIIKYNTNTNAMYSEYNLMYPKPRMISYIYIFLAVKLNLAEFRFSGGKLYLSTMISSLTVIGKVSIVTVKRNHKDGQVNAERYLMSAPVNKLSGKNFFKKVALTLLFMPGHLFICPRNNLHLVCSSEIRMSKLFSHF